MNDVYALCLLGMRKETSLSILNIWTRSGPACFRHHSYAAP